MTVNEFETRDVQGAGYVPMTRAGPLDLRTQNRMCHQIVRHGALQISMFRSILKIVVWYYLELIVN